MGTSYESVVEEEDSADADAKAKATSDAVSSARLLERDLPPEGEARSESILEVLGCAACTPQNNEFAALCRGVS